MKTLLITTAAAGLIATSFPAKAIDAYAPALTEQFVGWCTGTQNQPQTVCSCAVSKAALEIPASAMASFLSAAEGGGMMATAQGVGATALQIITTCAAGGGGGGTTSSGASMLNSLGGALGKQ